MPLTRSHARLPQFHTMFINDLSLQIRLGCLPDERVQTQEVRVSLEFRFLSAPLGTQTDELDDTLCYAQICDALKNSCAGKEFRLIESLAQVFWNAVLQVFTDCPALKNLETLFAVTVHKVNPPVTDLQGGTFYRIGDFA